MSSEYVRFSSRVSRGEEGPFSHNFAMRNILNFMYSDLVGETCLAFVQFPDNELFHRVWNGA